MTDQFELHVTGGFEELCGTWNIAVEGWGRKRASWTIARGPDGWPCGWTDTDIIAQVVSEVIKELRHGKGATA